MPRPEKAQNYILEVAPPTAKGAAIPSAATFEKVGFTRTKGLTRSTGAIDTVSDENPDNDDAIPGMKSFAFSGDGLFVYDDAGQQAIEDAYDTQDSDNYPWFRITSNTSGANEYVGQVIITQLEGPSGSTNEVLTYSISTRGIGVLTKQAIT